MATYVADGNGNRTITASPGVEGVTGGPGYDTYVVPDFFQQCQLAYAYKSTTTITDPQGLAGLDAVEAIRFLDGTVQLDKTYSTAGQVLRLYDAALGRAPDGAGLSYWVGQLQAGATLQNVAQSFLGSSEFAARSGSPDDATFVGQLYQDVLGRAADAAGAAYWTGQLEAGVSRAAVLVSFSESPENLVRESARTVGSAPGVFVPDQVAASAARLYDTALGRTPDSSGLAYWIGRIEGGQATLQDEAAAMIDSPEFQAQYGALSDASFVGQLYRNVLGRAGDAAGTAYWTGQLATGAVSRSGVVLGFSDSPEHQAALAAQIGTGGIVTTS